MRIWYPCRSRYELTMYPHSVRGCGCNTLRLWIHNPCTMYIHKGMEKTELRESMWADEQHEMKFFVERRLSIQVKASLIKNIQSGRLRQRER